MTAPLRSARDLRARLSELGAGPLHTRSVLRAWLGGRPLARAGERRSHRLPARVLAGLPELEASLDGLAREVERHAADDGSTRSLLTLGSGRTVERVHLPREGLCVSTQVGCAVGCRFCKTGEEGLLAQLSTLEILAQVVGVRRRAPVRRVVFMGMGEPLHNLEAVLESIDLLGEEGGLPHKGLVLSTVGDPEAFVRLQQRTVRPALALSLHTLRSDLREELLPRAPRVEPAELYRAAQAYADRSGHPLLLQWTLLAGVNDGVEEARDLARLLAGRRTLVNYIPFNSVEGAGWERPPAERTRELVTTLRAAGVLATVRDSAGQDVDGGCGQLRARALAAGPDQGPGASSETSSLAS